MATVLVVDDDTVNREFLRALLAHHGHRAVVAPDGFDALALARRERPDAVIADVLMPGLDGYELARRLRAEPTTQLIPIAFYTAHYSEHEVRTLANACGVQKVIRKPSKPAALIEALDSMLALAPVAERPATEAEFVREHVDTLKAKLVEKAAALNRSEDRFRIIAESAPVGILLGDADGSAVYANPCLREITGYNRDQLLGAGWLALVDEAQREAILALVTNGQLTGSHRHRVRIDRAEPGPLWLDVHLRPIADESRRAGFVVLFDDVTFAVEAEARRVAEAEREAEMLRHSARLAHRLTEAQRVAHLGTWDLDLATGQLTVSSELREMLGVSSAQPHRTDLYRLAHPDDRHRIRRLVERAEHSGRPFTDELRMTTADGSLREMVIFGEPVAEHTAPVPRGGQAPPDVPPDVPSDRPADDASDRPPAEAPDGSADEASERRGPVRTLWGVLQDITEVRAAQRSAEEARAHWQAEHRVLELLQQAMLPAALPTVPGAHLAAAYIAATDRLDIGGDWYDVFRLPDGRVLLSVGDVSGHDQHAAATMGPVRTALRAYSVEDPDPATALARLNRFIALGYPRGTLITALVAVYDPESRILTWANAGHPAPLILTAAAGQAASAGQTPSAGQRASAGPPDGTGASVRVLVEHGPVLGAVAEAGFPAVSLTLPAGAALCCYTDGLVERRGSTGDRDHARLLRVAAQSFAEVASAPTHPIPPAARLVERVSNEMLASHAPEDDVCLLVLWTLPAEPDEPQELSAAPAGLLGRAPDAPLANHPSKRV